MHHSIITSYVMFLLIYDNSVGRKECGMLTGGMEN